nr:immunoglobulin heavy chain junction region [Mus musculus]
CARIDDPLYFDVW